MRFKVIATFVALALIAGASCVALSLSSGVAWAEDASRHQDAENTFTKWVTEWPNMAGVVGGDVGRGAFAGEVLDAVFPSTPDDPGFIHALYHFNGRLHSFTADVHVTQVRNKAVIIGLVIDGWLEGNLVEGEYTQIQCTHDNKTTDCFRGTLDILRGTRP
jgi:hypothetical protein